MRRGKLAVVIGMETSSPLCSKLGDDAPRCTRADVSRGVRRVRRLGVRSMFIAHWIDNAFAGPALQPSDNGTLIGLMQRQATGRDFGVVPCGEGDEGEGRCNARGLTSLGRHLLRRMRSEGMLIEADHLSQRSKRAVLDFARAAGYPVVSGHTDTGGEWTPAQLRLLYRLGSLASATPETAPGLAAKVLRLRRGSARRRPAVALGTDTGGLAALPGPRRGSGVRPLAYPFRSYDGRLRFTRQRTGRRAFDLNADGVAHYGLFADLLADVRRQPGGGRAMATLFRSAEAYVRMWERAIARRSRAVTRLGALLVIAAAVLPASPAAAQGWAVSSGSGPRELQAVISLDAAGAPAIAVRRGARQLLPPGGLGLRTATTDLTRGLRRVGLARTRVITERYATVAGKRRRHVSRLRERVLTFAGAGGARLELHVRVAHDGVAYRYRLPERRAHRVLSEASAFRLPTAAPAWTSGYVPDDPAQSDRSNLLLYYESLPHRAARRPGERRDRVPGSVLARPWRARVDHGVRARRRLRRHPPAGSRGWAVRGGAAAARRPGGHRGAVDHAVADDRARQPGPGGAQRPGAGPGAAVPDSRHQLDSAGQRGLVMERGHRAARAATPASASTCATRRAVAGATWWLTRAGALVGRRRWSATRADAG